MHGRYSSTGDRPPPSSSPDSLPSYTMTSSPSSSPTPSLPDASPTSHTDFTPDEEPVLSLSHPFTSALSTTRIVQSHSPHWNSLHHYPNNHITNTKYTLWSFLPLSLYNQCRLAMNKYFLLIALLQLWPYITPVNPVTTWVPLAVIFLISTVKEGVDDYRRMRQDRLANERRVTIVTSMGAVECASEQVQCGDIVRVLEGEEFCADMVLLASSEKSGACWIETSNVDGETNLKGRVALPETQRLIEADSNDGEGLGRLRCTVECAVPNKNIYGFDSTITLSNDSTLALSTEQLLLQATTLCNTPYIYGLVVYTGNETKVGQNKNVPRHKQTTLDAQIDTTIIVLFVLQCAFIVVWGITGSVLLYIDEDKPVWYLNLQDLDWYDPAVIPLRFLLLASMMIPISLKVTLDLIKLMYSLWIRWDLGMWDDKRGVGAEARNTALAEELGCVQYVMTDKTGTLTENVMMMREMATQTRQYRRGEDGTPRVEDAEVSGDLSTDERLQGDVKEEEKEVTELLRCLMLCNTVVPSHKQPVHHSQQSRPSSPVPMSSSPATTPAIHYSSSSPDELCLVQFASSIGYVLESRDNHLLTARGGVGVRSAQWTVLAVCDFTSTRKRMSVVVKDSAGHIQLLMKGADDVVFARVRKGSDEQKRVESYKAVLDGYGRKGLRTLVFAVRDVSEAEWKEWSVRYHRASLDVGSREQALADVYETIEHDVALVGVTGIEDKLQADVEETLVTLREAGVKVWMLTGDKQQTAEEIGRSSGLVARRDRIHYINAANRTELTAVLEGVARDIQTSSSSTSSSPSSYVLIVDGATLSLCLLYHADLFYILSSSATSVVCCRCTPSQKSAVTALLVSHHHVTLGIGDGANDCLEENTLVMLADGRSTKPARDVLVGDKLLGTGGRTATVTSVPFTRSEAAMYRITAASGAYFTATPGHLVTLVWRRRTTVAVHSAHDRLSYPSVTVTMWRSDTLQPVLQRFRFRTPSLFHPALQPGFTPQVVYISYEEALAAYNAWLAANNRHNGHVKQSLEADQGRISVSIHQTSSRRSKKLKRACFEWVIPGRPWTPEPILVNSVQEAKEYAWGWYHRLFPIDTQLADNTTAAVPVDSVVDEQPDETEDEDEDEDVLEKRPANPTTPITSTIPQLYQHWSELIAADRGWRPLQHGDLIEVRADHLAKERIFHQLTSNDEECVGLLLNTVPMLPTLHTATSTTASLLTAGGDALDSIKSAVLSLAHSVADGQDVCSDSLQLMTALHTIRPLVTADEVRLGLFLPNPLTELSLQNSVSQQALTLAQLRLALSSLSSADISEEDGVFIYALNPIAASPVEMDSTRDKYTPLCKASMTLALAAGANALVAFGSAAQIRWRALASELAGVVSSETTYSDADRVWSTWLGMSSGERVRVVYSPHPCNTHKLLEVTLAIRAARIHLGYSHDPLTDDEFAGLAGVERSQSDHISPLKSVALDPTATTSVGWQVDGDGRFVLGNSVLTHNCPMIQMANVGVGISGREGMQAARASDFSISQFSHLRRLLLVHGRWSYVRTAWIAQYCLYKSLIIALVQLSFAFVSRFSGASFFDSFSIMSYNLFYTSVLGVFYLFEQDLSAATLLQRPQLYATSRERQNYTITTLLWWLARSLYQSLLVSIVTFSIWLGSTAVHGLGDTNQLGIALIAYSSIVLVQCFTLYLEMTFIVIWVHVIVVVTVVGFLLINVVVSSSSGMEAYSVYVGLLGDPVYWFTVLLCVVGCLLPLVGVKYWWRTELPSQIDLAQQEQVEESANKRARTTSGAGLLSGGSFPSYDTGNPSTHITLPATKQFLNNIKRTRKARKHRTDKRESRKRLITPDGAEEENSVQMYDTSRENKDDGEEEDEKGHVIRLDGDDVDGGEEVEVALGDDSLTSVDMDEDSDPRLHELEDEYGDEEDDAEEEKKGRRR